MNKRNINSAKPNKILLLTISFIKGFIAMSIVFYVFYFYKNIITVISLLLLHPLILYLLIEPDLRKVTNKNILIMFTTGQSLATVLFLTAFYYFC